MIGGPPGIAATAGLACVIAALGLAGCGVGGLSVAAHTAHPPPSPSSPPAASGAGGIPAASSTTSAGADGVLIAQRTHEYPQPPAAESVVGGWRDPEQAVTVFAQTYINWTEATVSLRLRTLALVSVGQARSLVSLSASETAADYELHRGGIANSGIVESVAPLRGIPRQYVVVTRERTTATRTAAYRGLLPAWHVSVATVTRVSGGLWVLSGWQPES